MLNNSQYLFPHLVRYFLFLSLFCFSITQITQTRVIFHIPGHDTLGFIVLTASVSCTTINIHFMDNLNHLFQLLHVLFPCLLLSLVQTMNTEKLLPISFQPTALTCDYCYSEGHMPCHPCLSGFLSLSGTPPRGQGANPINVQWGNNPRSQQEWALCRWANDKASASHLA